MPSPDRFGNNKKFLILKSPPLPVFAPPSMSSEAENQIADALSDFFNKKKNMGGGPGVFFQKKKILGGAWSDPVRFWYAPFFIEGGSQNHVPI